MCYVAGNTAADAGLPECDDTSTELGREEAMWAEQRDRLSAYVEEWKPKLNQGCRHVPLKICPLNKATNSVGQRDVIEGAMESFDPADQITWDGSAQDKSHYPIRRGRNVIYLDAPGPFHFSMGILLRPKLESFKAAAERRR